MLPRMLPLQSPSFLQPPSTPVPTAHHNNSPSSSNYHRPHNSSPLAESGPSTPIPSPLTVRRRLQYKSRTPSTPQPSSSRTLAHARVPSSGGGSVFGSGTGIGGARGLDVHEDTPQKAFLRQKFKARCFERAAKARAKAIRGRRYTGEASSDGFEEMTMDDDDSEDDEDIMQDELFRRIMANTNRKERHSFRISYADEVGSSFDPDIENVEEWEYELAGSGESVVPYFQAYPHIDPTPADLDDEELEAYAEECARRAALADFEDLPQDELFNLSDVEELSQKPIHSTVDDGDVEMH